jgi:lipopolysaccharide/colanic/teichoic acid biosynthesis glycosyltransferase
MKRIVPICRSLLDRVVALLFLIVLAPSMALAAFLLRANTDEPILVTDDLIAADGTPLRTYRFRTTGRGTTAFRSIGHFLRLYSIDEFPGLWAIVRGQISLGQFFRLGRSR